jgi:hypothetical protein
MCLASMSSGMTMSLSSRNLILLMFAENMTPLVRRAVLSLFMTSNRVVDKEMYLVRLALEFGNTAENCLINRLISA